MYKITFSKKADKVLRKIPKNIAFKIANKIKELASNPQGMSNVKKLINYEGYRLRVGYWRVVYTLNNNELIIHIINIKTRGDIYK